MKNQIRSFLLLLTISLFFQCKKGAENPLSFLPPVSSTGANTFGCLVDGKVLIPRDGAATIEAPYPHKGIEPVFGPDKKSVDLKLYNEKDRAPAPFFLDIYLIDTNNIHVGEYTWQQTSFIGGNTDHWVHHVYGSFYDNEIKNYAWFGSYDGSGTTTIARIDSTNHIISGTFSGKLKRRRDGAKEITITNGRFDINWGTVYSKKFP